MLPERKQTTVLLPAPHPGQIHVRESARRFNWLSAGRRWRKTTLAVSVAVEAALFGGTYIWGAPTFDQVRIGFNETRRACGNIAHFNLSRMTVDMPNGGRIIYRSLDNPDNVRGYTADGVIIDEASFVKPESWSEILRPMLADTGGWLWAIGTPNGKNWFFVESVKARDRDDSMSWQIPSFGVETVDRKLIRKPHPLENPNLKFSEVLQMWETMPERTFHQEILAAFLSGEGAVFRNIAACLHAPLDAVPEHHRGHTIVAGTDWGKHQDYHATSIGCATCRVELELYRVKTADYIYQRERIKQLFAYWRVNRALGETNAMGEPNLEILQRERVPIAGFTTTASSKPPLIENLKLALEGEEWQFLADPVATAELEAYEQRVSAHTGRSTYGAPEGVHDDTVMARAMMVQCGGQRRIIGFAQGKTKGWTTK